ncbi:MAG: von Willebrand factor type A domain-containing protein [Prosthecobacter sp.]|jgi:secreted protein with Ig-like and vWFA domain|nr:von Willebrand factor type A domain-containing protein [Prosthecobacter sp.]
MKPEQLTAWALDELPPEERADLEAKLQEDAEARETAQSTRAFCAMLTRELRDDTIALSPGQKARILAAHAPSLAHADPFAPKPLRWWQRPGIPMAAAAAVVVLGSLLAVRLEQESAQPEQQVVSRPVAADAKVKISPELKQEIGKKDFPAPPPPQNRIVTSSSAAAIALEPLEMPKLEAAAPSPKPMSLPESQVGFGAGLKKAIPPSTASPPPSPGLALQVARQMPGHMPAPAAAADSPMLPSTAAESRGRYAEPKEKESYAAIAENALTSVAREPLSTFSIDVDTASYANVRRFLNQNTRPPRDAVRLEELINYFPTAEPGPAADSEHPFAIRTAMAACPWQPQHRLLRIHLKARDVPTGEKPSNLVFLVDVSGSMSPPERLPLVQRCLRMLTERLGEKDRVSLVTYAGGTQVVLPATPGTEKTTILGAIDRLQAGGSTHGSAGIRLAYEEALKGYIQDGVNRVLLCTDGDFNVGISDPKELETFITEKARSGVFLSVLGFGTGNLKDHTMETLADKGNGNYAYIDSLSEARKVLVEQMQGTLVTLAKDVKIQVEFNPAVIREYRLIGYENRLLAKEDFNDDTKDAGEIGAGHTVTALYELVPANLPPGSEPRPRVDKLKYQPADAIIAAAPMKSLNPALAEEALTVKLRYKEPTGSTSKLLEVPVKDHAPAIEKTDPEFQFTAAVAGFGLLLRESSYAGQLTWDQVRQLARQGKGTDPQGYRGEFLQLIEKAAAQ